MLVKDSNSGMSHSGEGKVTLKQGFENEEIMRMPYSVKLERLESFLGKGFMGMWILSLWSHQMSLESSSKWERELPSGGVVRKVRERIWDNLPK